MNGRSQIRNLWRRSVRFWAPAGLLDAYWKYQHAPTKFQLPKCELEEIFPGIGSLEVIIEMAQLKRRDQCTLPLQELLTLAGICKCAHPRRIFEIGTYTGSSTLVMAINTGPETEIFTLDLDPGERNIHERGWASGGSPAFAVGSSYQNAQFRTRIHQLYGNSIAYDYSPFYGTVDLVFIDGDHVYQVVKKDTENALKMLRPGGIIVWDDYLRHEEYPTCGGVRRCADEFLKSRQAFQIAGTRFAIYLDTPLGRQHLYECSAPQGCV